MTWQPSTDFMAPNPIGLAGRFEQLVAEKPARFADEAGLFREVEPVYLHSVVRGLTRAVEKEQAIAWGAHHRTLRMNRRAASRAFLRTYAWPADLKIGTRAGGPRVRRSAASWESG